MPLADDRRLPDELTAVAAIGFDYAEGDGVDFEPFDEFLTAEDTTHWLRAWTGNTALDGDAFRIFGQDGTGGYAAFWLVRPEHQLADQPVVFLGSEGETGVVACDLADYLWLLADGFGPYEAVQYPDRAARPNAELRQIAELYAPARARSAREVIAAAQAAFPHFEDTIAGICR